MTHDNALPDPLTTSFTVHTHPLYNEGMNSATQTLHLPRQTKPRGRHPDKRLTAGFVRTVAPGRYCDGQGLYLYVQPSGTRSWVQRLVIHGRRRDLGLGSVALVPLAEARETARVNRKLAREGGDPLAEKRRAEGTPTFAEAARRVLDQKRAGWRNGRHPQSWWTSLERYAFPRIGARPVSDVTSAEVLEVLTPVWHVKAQTARRVRERIRAVLEWAVAMEWTAATTRVTASGRSSDRSRQRWSTCGRSRTRTCRQPSHGCGHPGRPTSSRWRSSFSC